MLWPRSSVGNTTINVFHAPFSVPVGSKCLVLFVPCDSPLMRALAQVRFEKHTCHFPSMHVIVPHVSVRVVVCMRTLHLSTFIHECSCTHFSTLLVMLVTLLYLFCDVFSLKAQHTSDTFCCVLSSHCSGASFFVTEVGLGDVRGRCCGRGFCAVQ